MICLFLECELPISVRTISPSWSSKTPNSVITMSTHLRSTKIKVNKGDTKNVSHLFPVKGRVQCSSSLCPPPFAVCSIVTTTWIIKMEIRTFKIKKRSNARDLRVGSSHQIHRTPHSFHHLPRDHPVGQITTTGYLQWSSFIQYTQGEIVPKCVKNELSPAWRPR